LEVVKASKVSEVVAIPSVAGVTRSAEVAIPSAGVEQAVVEQAAAEIHSVAAVCKAFEAWGEWAEAWVEETREVATKVAATG
jgi:hypothetical protein